MGGGNQKFYWDRFFLPGEGNLRRSGLKIQTFNKAKQLSVNTEHQLKSKLTWPKCPKSMKLKQKLNRSNDLGYNLKIGGIPQFTLCKLRKQKYVSVNQTK